jgi:hypothetical protein
MSLLDDAKAHSTKKRPTVPITNERVELALAWLTDEVSITQLAHALDGNRPASNAYVSIAIALREAYRKGRLTIKGD